MNRLLIVGAGGHGRAVAEAVQLAGEFELAGFADDGWPGLREVWDHPVLAATGDLAACRAKADAAIVAIGNNAVREALHARLRAAGFVLATVVHPRAFVSPRATLGAGCAVMAGAIVGTEARLGEGAIVNCGAVVDHHCEVADFGHLGVAACMAGGSVLGRGAWMQAGSALGYGVRVADGAVLQPGEARRSG
jgi:sugar O-acyltransferase (sialic acid O-acetyltransferase NeuD family)